MNTYGYEKMYLEKDLIEDKLYQTTTINGKIFTVLFSTFTHKIHPFYDGNGRKSSILFTKNHEIMKLIDKEENLKTNNIKWIFWNVKWIVLNAQSLQKPIILQ